MTRIALLVALTAALPLFAQEEGKDPDGAKAYFDVPKGTVITYSVKGGPQPVEMVTTITSNEAVAGGHLMKMEQKVSTGGRVVATTKQAYRLKDGKIVQESDGTGSTPKSMTVLKLPLKVGATFSETLGQGVKANYTIKRLDAKLTVAGRELTDVLVVEQVVEIGPQKQTTMSYYAKGLWLVKSVTTGLNNFTIEATKIAAPAAAKTD